MNRLYPVLFGALLLAGSQTLAQTQPTALSLPVSENFGSAGFSSPRPGMASWTGSGTRPYATQADAEASDAGADATINASTPASGGAGGQYGHASSGNARLTILQSGNATSGSTQIVMAVNTTTAGSLQVAYDLSLTVANARDFGLALQYRIGSSGAFTTVAGSSVIYNASSTNGGDADNATDLDNYSFTLPAAALGQPLVQLRWITWRPTTGSGSACGLGIDNITVTGSAPQPCAEPSAQPTALNLTPNPASILGSFTAASPAASGYIVIQSRSPILSSPPTDGLTYITGQPFGSTGSDTVVSVGSATTFTASGLRYSTQYYFYIFSFNNLACTGGPNYLTTAPLTGNATTTLPANCTTPPAPASGLTLTSGLTNISGSCTISQPDQQVLILYSTGNTLSVQPVNGSAYTPGQSLGNGTVAYYGGTGNFNVSGLTANTTYYFHAYLANTGCLGQPFYSATAWVLPKTTLNGTGEPAGYYNAAAGKSCADLKTTLSSIITANYIQLTYTPGVWNAYQTTDLKRNDANTADVIWDMYSDNPSGPDPYTFTYITGQCGNYSQESDCYNREHSFPQSWFGGSVYPMYSDINHIFPTDGFVNNKRGNFPFGKVGTPTYTSLNGSKLGNSVSPGYSGTVFEPIDAYKGDFARAIFYFVTRYESQIAGFQANSNANEILSGNAWPALDDWALNQLYQWHLQDPVSTKELNRNNAVYAIQGNRNPFIDRPEYVFEVWKCNSVVGVRDLADQQERIRLFPNPAGKTMTLSLEKAIPRTVQLQVLDITGRLVQQKTLARGETRTTISLTTLPQGQYLLRLVNSNEVVTKGFVVVE